VTRPAGPADPDIAKAEAAPAAEPAARPDDADPPDVHDGDGDGGDGPDEPEYVLAPAGRGRRALTALLVLVLAGALVAAGLAIGAATGIGRPYVPTDDAIDTGFARDMIVHHEQAVKMAEIARDYSTDGPIKLLAFDIETQQIGQVGQMRGWLATWGLSENTDRPHMSWMPAALGHVHDSADGALMPGMATTAQMRRLAALKGTKQGDILFLQLMIRHHEGGLAMAKYAAANAKVDYVSGLAGKIVTAQTSEVLQMEQMLLARGGQKLPADN
jgi:uncharacterized protein (DUF305 family)